MFSIVFVVGVFVFAPGLDEKKVYCTYSFTLVNKKNRSFFLSFVLSAYSMDRSTAVFSPLSLCWIISVGNKVNGERTAGPSQ